ncbi:hypothetical protein ACFUC2_05250 [[Kitasatospora] papulosa]|uniref:hypothetical protein n=1 Tax=Streptomyces TaxID=1883 RepID=UPI003327EFA7
MTTPPLPISLAAMCELACAEALLPRVRMGIAVIAREVFMEDPATPGNAMRVNLARTALSPSEALAASMAPGLMVSPALLLAAAATGSTDGPTMAAGLSDELILDAIRGAWNAAAGVGPATSPAAG